MKPATEAMPHEATATPCPEAHDAGQEWVCVLDSQWRWVHGCSAWESLLGWSPDVTPGRDWFDQIHPEDRPLIERLAPAPPDPEKTLCFEARIHPASDTAYRRTSWNVRWNAQVGIYFGTIRLVDHDNDHAHHDAPADPQQWLRAQRLETVGCLTAGVAHDVNNFFTSIIAAMSMIDPTNPSSITVSDVKRTVESSAKRGAKLVRQLLRFVQGGQSAKGLLSIREIAEECLLIVKASLPKGVTVRCQIEPDLRSIVGDATQILQVLINLIVNAGDAMQHGGKLIIRAGNQRLAPEDIPEDSGLKPGPYVRLSVIDSGPGVPPEHATHIFEPFYSTKAPNHGTGLGLATARLIAVNHGGWLNHENGAGGGAGFHLLLPAAPQSMTPSGPKPCRELPMSVLVAEGEPAVRRVLVHSVKKIGLNSIDVATGQACLQLSTEELESVTAAVIDLTLPDMDGLELARTLRSRRPDLKLLITTPSMHGDLERIAFQTSEWEGAAWIEKPFRRGELLRSLQQLADTPTPLVESPCRSAA